MINRAIILGHVGQKPEIRRTQDGKPIANFSMATSERWKDKNGEKHERTTWHRVVVFHEGLAKVVEQYVSKGSKLYVEGQMQTRTWKDNAGIERYVTEIVLQGFGSNLVLLDRKEGVPAAESVDDYSQAPARNSDAAKAPAFDADIPF
jgi:single-strand DNA-binding protein